ncbi:hypothetical protein [Shimazuella kribbensis]|uniref:hypothetical protein n=1 Tax=Shimazuella kribbensis TaxID=139808 RepID=UPI0012EC9C48|nr:hypothetical protein [Shimazuella kribbensis]
MQPQVIFIWPSDRVLALVRQIDPIYFIGQIALRDTAGFVLLPIRLIPVFCSTDS